MSIYGHLFSCDNIFLYVGASEQWKFEAIDSFHHISVGTHTNICFRSTYFDQRCQIRFIGKCIAGYCEWKLVWTLLRNRGGSQRNNSLFRFERESFEEKPRALRSSWTPDFFLRRHCQKEYLFIDHHGSISIRVRRVRFLLGKVRNRIMDFPCYILVRSLLLIFCHAIFCER